MKFKGNYSQLEALGYEFRKLFAREYPVYTKDDVWIWVGADVEVADMYALSDLLLTAVKNGNEVLNKFGMTVLNKETNTLEPRERKHEHIAVYAAKKGISTSEVIDIINGDEDSPASEEYHADYAKYFKETKFFSIEEKTIAAIKELIELDYI